MFAHIKAVWTFRYFWMSLVRMDLRSRYRRSFLGIGWSVLHPIAMSGVFCLVFAEIMKVQAGDADANGFPAQWRWYAAFLLSGMSVWEFIRNSTAMGCQALLMNEAYIRQCPLPYGIYPLRTVMGTAIHFVISMAVVVVLVSLLKGSTAPIGKLWAVLPVMVMLFFFCWALATLSAFATVYFHDTAHLVEVGSQLYFFMTPIMYQRQILEAQPWGRVLVDLNPVVTFLELIRQPLVSDKVADGSLYFQALILTVAAVGLAFGTIGWLQKKVIFHM